MEKRYPAGTNLRKEVPGLAILMSGEVEFKARTIVRDKEERTIMVKG